MSKERREYHKYIRWANEVWNQKCFYQTQARTYLAIGNFAKWQEANQKYKKYSQEWKRLNKIRTEKLLQYLQTSFPY